MISMDRKGISQARARRRRNEGDNEDDFAASAPVFVASVTLDGSKKSRPGAIRRTSARSAVGMRVSASIGISICLCLFSMSNAYTIPSIATRTSSVTAYLSVPRPSVVPVGRHAASKAALPGTRFPSHTAISPTSTSTQLLLFPRQSDEQSIRSRALQLRRKWWNYSLRSVKSKMHATVNGALASDAGADVRANHEYDPFATANDIAPKTKPLTKSMAFYVAFIIDRLSKNRHENYRIKQRGKRRAMLKSLNEQRKNVITLANYTRHIVAPSFLFLFLGALTTSIIPLYYSRCMQAVSTLSGGEANLMENLMGLLVMSTLGALFTGARGSLFWIGGSRTNYNIRVKLHRSLLLQDAAFFDMNETGYLLSRLNSDVNRIGSVISYHVNIVCRQFAQFVFGSIYMFRISPRLSMWTFLGIAVVGWVSAVYGSFARDLAERVQNTFADATAVAETSFSMSETIRAYDGVEIESDRFENAQSKALELEEVQAWGYGTHKFVSDTLQSILSVGLLLACWTLGKSGGLEAAKLTTFLFYSNFVLESSNEVGDQWAKIQGAVGASTSVFDLIKRVPDVRDPPTTASGMSSPDLLASVTVAAPDGTDLSINGEANQSNGKSNGVANGTKLPHPIGEVDPKQPLISMKDMTVTYGAMEKPALDHVDLDIFPNDRIAIVGRSGSGKSTMLRSILRFYDPSSGSIALDGIELSAMTRAELSKKVAVVQQEPELFPMSLVENVLYSIPKDEVDPETGEPCYSESLRQAAFESLILAGLPIYPGNELALELDTRVGEGGRSLSGGQRQRVAIARAVIRNPRVLLLDEPTAALDSESERKVVESLNMAATKYTKSIVMVTHRLGVIRSLGVNRVIVLDKGRIVEEGHPEDLLWNEDGLYAALAREQGIVAKKREMSTPDQQ